MDGKLATSNFKMLAFHALAAFKLAIVGSGKVGISDITSKMAKLVRDDNPQSWSLTVDGTAVKPSMFKQAFGGACGKNVKYLVCHGGNPGEIGTSYSIGVGAVKIMKPYTNTGAHKKKEKLRDMHASKHIFQKDKGAGMGFGAKMVLSSTNADKVTDVMSFETHPAEFASGVFITAILNKEHSNSTRMVGAVTSTSQMMLTRWCWNRSMPNQRR